MNTLTLIKILLTVPWLIALSLRDIKKHELPNKLLLAVALAALPVTLAGGRDYFLLSLVTAFLSSLFLLLPFFLRAAGAGDVKMLFVAGFIAGPGNTLNLILLISFAGLFLAVIMLLLKKTNPARLKHYCRCLFDFTYDRAAGKKALPSAGDESCRVPFGVAIAAGLILNLLVQYFYSL